ncbi:uncharacterized protein LOC123312503 [Coccinella septempunctata]|uniref:uncharacterized protein LOC123312503 n=1 Tax=Coccinella septempunctata TaxID=41139 RepID=UPI001D098079|nr:uncharacterized protein LOC123312503 [Coccinella septempunctata]
MFNLNAGISLTGEVIENFNKTISVLRNNQKTISSQLEGISGKFDQLSDNFYMYIQIKNLMDQIGISISIIIELIDEIENAISFSRLGILHHSIIKFSELYSIINKTKNLYGSSNLIFVDEREYHRFYELIKVDAYFVEFRIVFVLHFPIVHPEPFSHYHLFSIPTINNTIIIPKNTYLTSNEKWYQYASSPCIDLHSLYYCENDKLNNGSEVEDCLFQLLQLQKSTGSCQNHPVETSKNVVQKIGNGRFIMLAPTGMKIRTVCRRTDVSTLKGNFLLNVPKGCHFENSQEKFYNDREILKGEPMYLPQIAAELNATTLTAFKIKLEDFSLDQIHKLKKKQEEIQPLMEKQKSTKSLHEVLIIIIYLLFFIIISYFGSRKIKSWLRSRVPRNQTETEEFQPRAVPRNQPEREESQARAVPFFTT